MSDSNQIVDIASKFGVDLKQASSQRGLLWMIVAQGFVTLPPEHLKWFIWVSFTLVGALGLFRRDEAVVNPQVEKILVDKIPELKEVDSIDEIVSRGQKT